MTFLPKNLPLNTNGVKMASGFQSIREENRFDKVLFIAEKVSLVALGIMAAITSPTLFVSFFMAGIAWGLYSHMNKNSMENCGSIGSGCSQGFLEKLSGIKLPRAVSLLAEVSIAACHIEEYPIVFVPLVSVCLGSWAGKLGAETFDWAQKQVYPISNAKVA